MKFYLTDGTETDIKQFDPGSIVVARVTKPMTNEQFIEFSKANKYVFDLFSEHRLTLLLCPDWIDFKNWD